MFLFPFTRKPRLKIPTSFFPSLNCTSNFLVHAATNFFFIPQTFPVFIIALVQIMKIVVKNLIFFYCCCFSLSVHALSSDGTALLSLFSHWTDVPSSIKSSWNASDSTPCSWVGVECDNTTHLVTSLNLSGYQISGRLGPEISYLEHLRTIDLGVNAFSGSIPSHLTNCTLLEYLDLSYNTFTGEIPSKIGNLQKLTYISLYSNSLTGNIPDSLFSIPNLDTIYFNQNRLNGSIPSSIGNLTQLLYLYLYENQLSGPIPSSLGNCSNLLELYLNGNHLVGSLPENFDKLEHLVYLDLSNNSLEGSIPFSSGNCKDLATLVLSFNSFNGELPPSLMNCTILKVLAAVSSGLSGPIPASLGQLTKLEKLYLADNNFSGKIPTELGKCEALLELLLPENQLEGEIPSELGSLSQLQSLSLYSNKLSGEIPRTIWKIRSLQHLLVYRNNLTGELPLEMTELKQLKNISLFDNLFTGVIPQGLGINSSLTLLDFTNNAFTGPVPPNLCFRKKLKKLLLGYNHLEGGIPSQLGKCSTLTRVVLKKNNLSGVIPDFVKNGNPVFLDLSENGFSGKIPPTLANLGNATSIDLSVNKLSGFIPPELANLVNLQELDLSYNGLVGVLPSQLSLWQRLFKFDASHNLLSGSIPSTFGSLGELSILSLSENNLSGGIPTSLFELKKLSSLQLGGNALGGEIKIAAASRETLRLLNLSSNGLTGELPDLGKFTFLEELDIACNSISGTLGVLDGMHSLIFVNVSHNLFSGPVPAYLMKFLNSTPTSFSGNSGLCMRCDPKGGSNCPENSTIRRCDLQSNNGRHLSRAETAMVAIGVLLFTIFLLLVCAYMLLWRKNSGKGVAISAQEGASSLLTKVLEATENLNDKYVIGRGAHGIVYKAILGPGKVYAVKKLVFVGIKDGSRSMVREIQTIGKVRHRNLVKLEDFWLRKDYGLILYNYMENGSLHDILHETKPPVTLEWSVRYRIAIGTAQGLSYLHFDCDPSIVHRDIKPMNILLDSDLEPHISDFGIAKLLDQSAATSASNTLQGTVGYMAPETAFAATKSKESDVYSYGIVLLELITRKKALDPSLYGDTDIVSWVRSVWTETEELENIVDPSLLDEFIDSSVMEQVIEVLSLALRCTEKEVSKRPSMKEVVKLLTRSSSSIRSK